MKKILHITKGQMGGLDYVTKKVIAYLNNEFEQEVLCFYPKGAEIYSQFKNSKISKLDIRGEVVFVNPLPVFLKFFYADIIHVHHTKTWILTSPLCLFQRKVVYTFHINFGVRCKTNIFEKVLIHSIINYCTIFSRKIVFLTKGQYEHLSQYCFFKKMLINKAEFIPNFIEDELIVSSRTNFNQDVLFIGRKTKIKGFEDLLSLADRTKNTSFFLIGDIVDLVRLSPNITDYGIVDNMDIKKHLDKHTIYILPSYTEAFPLSILEAMARGMIILVSKLPGMTEIIEEGQNGFLFEPCDINHMVQILEYFKLNPSELVRISDNNICKVAKFTASIILPKYKNMYKAI